MATLLFANNIQTTLATSITSTQTSVTLASTAGLPNPTTGQYFIMTFTNGSTNEVVWVTAVSGSTITCVRGKEGTSASAFASGSYASCFPTAGTMQDLVQIDQLQNGSYTFANGAGTANALTATIASNLTTVPNGFQFVVNAANANTGAATLNLTLSSTISGGGSVSTGALPIYKNGNSALTGGEITGSNYLCLMTYNANYNGGSGAFVLENPYNAVTGVVGITQLQEEYFTYNAVSGSSDALTLSVPAGLTSLVDGATVTFRNTVAANSTTTPTLNVTYGSTVTGATVIKKYNSLPLSAGDTGGVGYICQLVYSSAASAWMLLNPAPGVAGGVTSITSGGTGLNVSSPSGAVTLTNTGVITVNGSAGIVTVTPANINALSLSTSSPQSVTGAVTFNGNNTFTGVNSVTSGGYFTAAVSTIGTSAYVATSGGATGFLSPTSVQLYQTGMGIEAYTGNAISIATSYGANATFNNTGYNQQGNNLASWFVTSDALIKTNIAPITGSLEKIKALKPSSFSYIDDTDTTNTGFIAQEFATVFPELTADSPVPKKYKDLVPEGTETIKGIIHDLNPYLVQAIQELNELVQTQANQIAALNKKVGL